MINEELKLYKDIWVRKGLRIDTVMIAEVYKNYKYFDLNENSVVLDLGANIGAFAKMCKDAKVKHYAGVEPNEENFQLLLKNIDPQFQVVYHAAVSTKTGELIPFYVRNSVRSASSSSTSPFKINSTMTTVQVPNIHIDCFIEAIEPNVLKMDIEGEEREIFAHWQGRVPSCVKQFAIEIHNEKFCKLFEKEYHPKMLADGFKLINITPNAGFIKHSTNSWTCFDITMTGTLWGFDLFYAR